MDEWELLIKLEMEPVADAEDIERTGQQLRAVLLLPGVESIRWVPVLAEPDDAKGPAVDWGQLLLTLSATGGVFTSLIMVARDWLSRHELAKSLKITIGCDSIELPRATDEEREQLIGAWVRRHESN